MKTGHSTTIGKGYPEKCLMYPLSNTINIILFEINKKGFTLEALKEVVVTLVEVYQLLDPVVIFYNDGTVAESAVRMSVLEKE